MSDAFSATMIVGALVLQDGTNGITEASTTRIAEQSAQPEIWRDDRVLVPMPIAQVPAGW